MEGPVQVRTFALDESATPSVDAMMQASDPTQLRKLYENLGLKSLVANADKQQRAEAARQTYEELPAADFRLYSSFLANVIALQDLTVPPPIEVVEVLAAAKQVELFDAIVVRRHPATQESLLLGQVNDGQGMRYFKIAHWGARLTSIEELRKRQRKDHAIGRMLKQVTGWRPSIELGMPNARNRSPVYFGAVTLLAAAAAWSFLLLPRFGWWAAMGALVLLMIRCGYYVVDNTRKDARQRYVVGTLIAANAVALAIFGGVSLNSWNNQSYTRDALVCGNAHQNTISHEWQVDTNTGTISIEGGFYGGTYYASSDEDVAKSLVGNWVRFTAHGHLGDTYATSAQILRPGSCG